MNRDEFLLSEFRKVLQKNAAQSVVDLDHTFPHKVDLFVQVHEEVIGKVVNNIPPHKWSYYRIGLITQGAADYTCGIYKFRAEENTLVIIPQRVTNSSSNWAAGSKGYFIVFNLDFFLQNHFPYKYLENKRILQPSVKPYISLTPAQAKNVEAIFKTILQEKQGNDQHNNELIALKLIELLILVERIYCDTEDLEENKTSQDIVTKFADLVEHNFVKERSVAFYASSLHIHPNYLNALVKTHTGLTAKESIQNRLLLETKYLLHSTALSIKEIAAELGFEDPNYFSAFFKRLEHLSPAAYRQSIV